MGSVHDDTLWYAQEARRRQDARLPEDIRLAFEYLRTDAIEAVGNVGGQRDRVLNSIEKLRALVIGAITAGERTGG